MLVGGRERRSETCLQILPLSTPEKRKLRFKVKRAVESCVNEEHGRVPHHAGEVDVRWCRGVFHIGDQLVLVLQKRLVPSHEKLSPWSFQHHMVCVVGKVMIIWQHPVCALSEHCLHRWRHPRLQVDIAKFPHKKLPRHSLGSRFKEFGQIVRVDLI